MRKKSKAHFLKLGLVESLQDFTHPQIQTIGIVFVVKHLGG
jgi:hypothetical protein